MPSNSRTWIWIVVAIFLVAAIIIFAFWFTEKRLAYAPALSGPVPAYAPAGQVISGFPASLLIDSGAAITQSYSLTYSATTSQYTVEWNSSSSPQSLAVGYLLYLESNNWRIVNQSATSAIRSIYAAGTLGSLNLTASPKAGGSAVILTYIPAPKVAPLPVAVLPADFPAFLNPDPSSVLVMANTSGSLETAIFLSKESLPILSSALLSSLTQEKWQIIQRANSSTLASVTTMSSSSQAVVIMQAMPPLGIQIQIQYSKTL